MGVWTLGSRERREGALARPMWICLLNDGRKLSGWAESPKPGDCLKGGHVKVMAPNGISQEPALLVPALTSVVVFCLLCIPRYQEWYLP